MSGVWVGAEETLEPMQLFLRFRQKYQQKHIVEMISAVATRSRHGGDRRRCVRAILLFGNA